MKDNNNGLLILIGIIFIGMTIALVGLSNNFAKINTNEPIQKNEKISVSGQSLLEVEPDQALVYMNIETEGETAKDAKDTNADISADVTAALKEMGIENSDIDTTSYNLYDRWDWDEISQKSEKNGYTLSHVLKITINDLEKIGEIIDTGIDAGANGVHSISYTLKKETQKSANADALDKASLRAKEKAQSIADSLDLKLGKIVTVTESNTYYTPYQFRNSVESSGAMLNAKTGISPEEVTVTANIEVEFAII